MVASSYVDPTACNRYANDDKEFIFCVKGRPFGCLVSPYLPTPTSSLIDYNLVRDLGIKMADLQYTKFFFAGNKLRILGRVAITVQTIHKGIASGNFPFKANVILGLKDCLEVDTVAIILYFIRCSDSVFVQLPDLLLLLFYLSTWFVFDCFRNYLICPIRA